MVTGSVFVVTGVCFCFDRVQLGLSYQAILGEIGSSWTRRTAGDSQVPPQKACNIKVAVKVDLDESR